MTFLLIPDKFKGSLTAEEVIGGMKEAIEEVFPGARCFPVLASDGGDGFLDAVARYRKLKRISGLYPDPLGREIEAAYLFDTDTKEAYVELAAASGLVLLHPKLRSAVKTTTIGTGLQIRDAIFQGAKTIYLGLGGSATNDGGTGIAHALGYRFRNREGQELHPCGSNLPKITTIDAGKVPAHYRDISFVAINDVNNPLYGPGGAAHVYAAQKGADPAEIDLLDKGLRHLDSLVAEQLGKRLGELPGTGAAGGASFGLKAFLDAEFLGGIQFIMKMAGVKELLRNEKIDYVITGEGKLDRQSLSGKLIQGVLEMAKEFGLPVIAVCGMLDADESHLKKAGFTDVVEVRDPNRSLEYNMQHAASLLKASMQHYLKTL